MRKCTVNGYFHLHTQASDGLYSATWYAEQAKARGCLFLITDHGYLWPSVYAYIQYPDLHPWVGVEMYYKDKKEKGHLTLIAYTDEGVRTLYRLQVKQPLTWETLTSVSLEDVAIGTGCIGSVARSWDDGRFSTLERLGGVIVHEIFPYDDTSPQRDFFMHSADLHALNEDLDALLLMYLSRPASRKMRWTGLHYHGAGMFALYGGQVGFEGSTLTVTGDIEKLSLLTGYGLTPKSAALPVSTITPAGVGNALPDLPERFAPDPVLVREKIVSMGYPVGKWVEEWNILTKHGYHKVVGLVASVAIALSKDMPVGYRGSGASSPTLNALLWGHKNIYTMTPQDLVKTDYRRFVDWSDAVKEYPPDIDLDVPSAIGDEEFPIQNLPHTRAAALDGLHPRSIALNLLRNALRTARRFDSEEEAARFLDNLVGTKWRIFNGSPSSIRPASGFWVGATPTWTPIQVLPKALKVDVLSNTAVGLLPLTRLQSEAPVFLTVASHLHSPIPARLAYLATEKNRGLTVSDVANIISVHRPGAASAPLLRDVFGEYAEEAARTVGLPFEDGLVWQEDVYALVFDAAREHGYGLEEAANIARKAMKAVSKKRLGDLEEVNRALGLTLAPAYTFNKGHALAYATYAHKMAHLPIEAWREHYGTIFDVYAKKTTEAALQTLASLVIVGGMLGVDLLFPPARKNRTLIEEYKQAVKAFASECTHENYVALRRAERAVFRVEVSTLRAFGESVRNLWDGGIAPWVGIASYILLKIQNGGRRVERCYLVTPHTATPFYDRSKGGKVFVAMGDKVTLTTPKPGTLERIKELSLVLTGSL